MDLLAVVSKLFDVLLVLYHVVVGLYPVHTLYNIIQLMTLNYLQPALRDYHCVTQHFSLVITFLEQHAHTSSQQIVRILE